MFAIVLAALDRSGSVLPILCAMAVHELAHVVMMLACGGQVRRLTLRFADFQIAASGLGYRQELLSALAGPLVNLICGAAFCMQRPSFAAYSLMHQTVCGKGRPLHTKCCAADQIDQRSRQRRKQLLPVAKAGCRDLKVCKPQRQPPHLSAAGQHHNNVRQLMYCHRAEDWQHRAAAVKRRKDNCKHKKAWPEFNCRHRSESQTSRTAPPAQPPLPAAVPSVLKTPVRSLFSVPHRQFS